jgi:hypothetical protein
MTFAVSLAWAQDVKVQAVPPAAAQAAEARAKAKAAAQNPGAAQPAAQPGAQPGDQKAGEQKAGEQKAGEPAVTQRPTKPEKPANPDELKVRPDSEGKIRFSFNGQPWQAVLEWLATISNMSLDWQELPGDFLNLTTQQAYTITEARDLINRHLFARGFTLLQNGEILSVVNIKKLDPGMVPRVTPQELAGRNAYDFVKVSFTLDSLLAEATAEELKPMISPNGKLNALKGTNRLEIMDAVINLREIQKLLKEEQSHQGQERLVREFQLQFARASEVVQQLNELLGIEDKKPKGPLTPEQMQQQQQQAMMRMQQQQQAQQAGAKPPGAKDEAQVNLVLNVRKNSILAHAPPDKMAIIDQAVKALDVSSQGAESLLANVNRMQIYRLGNIDPEPLAKTLTELGLLDPTTRLDVDKKNKTITAFAPIADHLTIRALVNKLDGSGRTFEVIQLRRLEADYVAGTVQFMMGGDEKDSQQQRRPYYIYSWGYGGGQEEQSTDKFRVDADVENNKLLLWANQIEMDEVYKLLAKLGEIPARGTNTNTVRVLNVEPGEDTAEALERLRRAWPSLAPNPLLMPNTDSLNGAGGRSDRRKAEAERKLKAAKNEEARSGPSPAGKRIDGRTKAVQPNIVPLDRRKEPVDTEEVIDAVAVVATPAVLRKAAAKAAPTEKTVDTELAQAVEPKAETPQNNGAKASDTKAAKADEGSSKKAAAPEKSAAPPSDSTVEQELDDALSTGDLPLLRGQPGVNGARGQGVPAEGRNRAANREPPPINVSVGANGELIITSPDTEALDLFEEMVNQIAPPRKEYKVFRLKHASAFSVTLNLEEYFALDEKKKDNDRYPYYFYYDDYGSQNKDETRRLSKRRELKFIYDTDTNTIIVQGADPSQLRVIEELVHLYDTPEPMDSRAARMTTVFTLKYSKAKIVGETVKDVYRDLLSQNDKALQGGDQQKKEGANADRVYITNFGDSGEEDPRATQVKFKGKLSIGIDELSNTLVVSTEGENLMSNVERMIKALDEAAKPSMNMVQVMKLGRGMDSDVRKAISRAFIQQQQQGTPQQPGAQQQGQNGQQQPNQNGQPNQEGRNPQNQ